MWVNEMIGWIPTNTYDVDKKLKKHIRIMQKKKHYIKVDSTLKE